MSGILDRLRGGLVDGMTDAPRDELSEALAAEQAMNEVLSESIADLEADNRGWLRLDGYAWGLQFTRMGLQEISASARLNWIANPLIRRAVNVRMFYTWGQGVEISARTAEVNDVLQTFMDDEMNQAVLFGHEARQAKDRALQLDGNVVLALITSPLTGRVQIRSIPWTEITEIIKNPQDRQDRWYYLREWTQQTINPVTGGIESGMQRAYYPEIGYRPAIRPKSFGTTPVMWDQPVMHLRVGMLDDMDFGISEVFSALSWARAYKSFLEDWASLAKALSKFAWKGKARTGRTAALRRAVEAPNTAGQLPVRNPPSAGQALVTDGDDLTPIVKTGATLDADSGRPLAMMVAAAMDIPYTILMGDPDIGNLATAKTLDRPTELAMQSRREMWSSVLRRLGNYAIDQAVKAPQGPLRGTVIRDRENDREIITLAGDVDRNLDIEWPSILEHDVLSQVQALVYADDTGHVPAEIICRLLLIALGVENVDEVMDELVDDNGDFLDPGLKATITAGTEAIRRFRAGEDPAAALA